MLVVGTITVLLLFNSLNTETIITSVSNPSLSIFTDLQRLHSNDLRCPCSSIAVPYNQFMSLSSTLHEICSSDLISDRWLAILKQSTIYYGSLDWRNRAYQQFYLLSQFCRIANETISNAVTNFLFQTMIVPNVLTQNDFQTQINKTILQFYESIIFYFRHLVEAVELHMQVDQYLIGSIGSVYSVLKFYTLQSIVTNITNNHNITEVCLCSFI